MRRWLKWLLIPLVLVLSVAGGQAYYWYQVESGIENLVALIRPFAKVEYANFSAFFLEPITLDGMTIRPNGYSEMITIERASLSSTSRGFFLTAYEQLSTGALDDPVSLSLFGLNYEINADFSIFSAESTKRSLDTLLCGDTRVINQATLKVMGYRYLQGDLHLVLDPSANKRLMKVRVGIELADFMKGKMDLWLALHQGGALRRQDLAKTSVQMFALNLTDLGYNKRWKTYCSQQEGVLPGDYMARYHTALAEKLADGNEEYRGSHLLDALFSARTERSLVAARWEPATPLEIQKLASVNSSGPLFSGAELALEVNGKMLELLDEELLVVHDLFGGDVRRAALAVVDDKTIDVQPIVLKDVSAMKEIVPGVIPIRPLEIEKTFLTTPMSDLDSYIGSSIKLKTFFGRDMEGVLVKVSENVISIQRQVEQGRATFPVTKDKIALVEVYR